MAKALEHTKIFAAHTEATARLHVLGALLERIGSHDDDDNPLEAWDLYELGKMIQAYADEAKRHFEAMTTTKLDLSAELRKEAANG